MRQNIFLILLSVSCGIMPISKRFRTFKLIFKSEINKPGSPIKISSSITSVTFLIISRLFFPRIPMILIGQLYNNFKDE